MMRTAPSYQLATVYSGFVRGFARPTNPCRQVDGSALIIDEEAVFQAYPDLVTSYF